jgi:protein-tyrosine phosphatase
MTEAYSRSLEFASAPNFRDLGGYRAGSGRRTRWQRLFRADSICDLTEADVSRLDALGLRGLVDFRTERERLSRPDRLPPGANLRILEPGFFPKGAVEMLNRSHAGTITAAEVESEVTSHYRRFVTDHADAYRQLLAFAAEPESYPLLIHCASGKDRTGFAAAILLLSVGVSREVVEEDYLLSNQYRRDVSHLFGPQTSREVIDLLLSVRPGYLAAAFDVIDRDYGSIDGYLTRALGVNDAMRARFVELLTEPAGAAVAPACALDPAE